MVQPVRFRRHGAPQSASKSVRVRSQNRVFMRRWYFRFARSLVYLGCGIAAFAVAGVAISDTPHDAGHALIEARQLYGLWALGLLLASMIIGPLTSILPWLPLKAPLMYARRAV